MRQSCTRPWRFPIKRALLDDRSSRVELRITDISEENLSSALYSKPDLATVALRCKPSRDTRIRIISIFSDRTVAPLNVTEPLLELLFSEYDVAPEFGDVIASFGDEPDIAEGRSNNARIQIDKSGAGEIFYEARYVELHGRGGENPWSLRHTGIFHKLCATSGTDIVLALHPVWKPSLELSIEGLRDDNNKRAAVCGNPMLLHEALVECYFDNWRWYMRFCGGRFNGTNDSAMATEPKYTDPNSSFGSVQSLRNTNDYVIFARACCSGNRDLLRRLSEAHTELGQSSKALEMHQSKMSGYIESADALERRIQNSIDLVGYTLTLRNQLESAEVATELRDVTEKLHQLTQHTVDDSATVRIITFVSAVYLPGSFVATLLGMNLFVFEDSSKRLIISPDFWIFIVLWIPLTLITGGIYVFVKSRPKSRQDMVGEKIRRNHERDYTRSITA